jgi:hypothetical protein
VLLVAQAILLAVAGIPIYLWASQRLGHPAGLAFQASYLVFWGVLAGVAFDFHHVALAVPAISTAAELTTYVSDATAAEIQQCLDVIPAGVSVSATDALVPHLTSREHIYEVTTEAGADYIAIDVSTLGKVNPADAKLRAIVQAAVSDGYGVACSRGYTVVLSKRTPGGELSPELQRWLVSDCSGAACLARP